MSDTNQNTNDPRQLVLVKNGERFIFRFEPGDESDVLERMLELARDPDSAFDSFDAAVLSHQMGTHLSEQLKHLNKAS
jgi:uncharacterized protein with von Willebrand factor type A (vWA) domain